MSPPQDLESAQYLTSTEDPPPSSEPQPRPASSLRSLEPLVSAFCLVAIAGSLIVAGCCWFLSGKKEPTKGRSLGEWITGQTWEERKADGQFGPFDTVFYPESKDDQPEFELPQGPVFSDP